MNYEVTLKCGAYTLTIKYFIALPYANPKRIPSDLELLTVLGKDPESTTTTAPYQAEEGIKAGGYGVVDDLSPIQDQVDCIRDDIICLLKDKELDVDESTTCKALSAKSQVVAGMNYEVTLKCGAYTLTIKYFIALPYANPERTPSDLELLTVLGKDPESTTTTAPYQAEEGIKAGGYGVVDDLSPIQDQV